MTQYCDSADNDCDGYIDEAGSIGEVTSYTDGDGDVELMLGSTQTLTNIDIKEPGTVEGLWNTHRADMARSGYYLSTVNALSIGDDIENYEFALYDQIFLELRLFAQQ